MPKKSLTYTEAIAEVEQIVAQLESNELSVDQLAQSVKRVAELLAFCKATLKGTEEEVHRIMSKLDE